LNILPPDPNQPGDEALNLWRLAVGSADAERDRQREEAS
jgi:hypothetical protein